MSILYFFQSIRNPILDALLGVITMLGEETAFMAAAILVFWCISKNMGLYLLSTGFIGTVANQFLKLIFRIPRPWVLDPKFEIVESAREAATGYSFPSGHTQSAVGTFGGIARFTTKKWLRLICIAICVLVPLSRMYLGVHTPLDVGVSLLIAAFLIFALYPIFKNLDKNPKGFYLLTVFMALFSLSYVLFVELYPFPADVDAHNLLHGTETAYTMLGCVLGLGAVLLLCKGLPKFDVKAPLLGQILKVALGLGIVLGLKAGLKPVLNLVFAGHPIARAVRYGLIVIFAAWLWPMTFPFFQKLGRKEATKA